MNNVII